MNIIRLRIALAGFLLTSLLLGGCATTLLYNHADWLIARQLDGYFDLTRSQKAFVSSRLDAILDRHRHEALPRYEAVLEHAGARVQRGLTVDDLNWAFAQYDQLKVDLFGRFASDGAEFVRLVKEPQVARLKKALQTRLAGEEGLLHETAQTRLAKRTERILALAREWLGPLNPQQEREITRLAMSFPDTLPAWHAHQARRHEQLITIVESRDSGETPTRLRDWLVQQEKDADPVFLQTANQLRQHIAELVISLDRSVTMEQRRHFLSKLADLAKMVRSLREA